MRNVAQAAAATPHHGSPPLPPSCWSLLSPRAPAALPSCMGKAVSQGSLLWIRTHLFGFARRQGDILFLKTGNVFVAAPTPLCKTNISQALGVSDDVTVTGTSARTSENVFLVEPGEFVLPGSQRSDGMLRTDGCFRPSQLDAAHIRAELETRLGLDLDAGAHGKLSPACVREGSIASASAGPARAEARLRLKLPLLVPVSQGLGICSQFCFCPRRCLCSPSRQHQTL